MGGNNDRSVSERWLAPRYGDKHGVKYRNKYGDNAILGPLDHGVQGAGGKHR